MLEKQRSEGQFGAGAYRRLDLSAVHGLKGRWRVRGWRGPREDGHLLFEDWMDNLIVNEGLNHALGVALTRETQTATWHLLITSGAPTVAAADTMGSHSGWDEYTGISDTERPVWAGSRDATAQATNPTAAQVTFNATGTVGGAGLVSQNSLGGSGGVLYAAGAFTGGNKTLNSGDTLDLTATFTNTPV